MALVVFSFDTGKKKSKTYSKTALQDQGSESSAQDALEGATFREKRTLIPLPGPHTEDQRGSGVKATDQLQSMEYKYVDSFYSSNLLLLSC